MQGTLKYEPLGLIDHDSLSDSETKEKTAEYEIVLGRRQIASLLFIAIVLAVVFSAVSYLAGRTAAPKPVQRPPAPPVPASPAPGANPVIEATTSVLPAAELPKPVPGTTGSVRPPLRPGRTAAR